MWGRRQKTRRLLWISHRRWRECPAGRVVTRLLKNETHIMRRKGCSFLISGERIDEAMDPQAFTKQWWGKSTKCDRSLMLIFNLNTLCAPLTWTRGTYIAHIMTWRTKTPAFLDSTVHINNSVPLFIWMWYESPVHSSWQPQIFCERNNCTEQKRGGNKKQRKACHIWVTVE